MDNLQLTVKMNNARIKELGLTNAEVAQQIYNSVEGIKNTTMDLEEADNVNISVEYMDRYRQTIDNLLDVYVSTPLGVKVPLREFASVDVGNRANIITKEDLEYTIDILGYTHTATSPGIYRKY